MTRVRGALKPGLGAGLWLMGALAAGAAWPAQAQWQVSSRTGWGGGQRVWDGSLQERSELVLRHRRADLGVSLDMRSSRTRLSGRAAALATGRPGQPVEQRGSWTLRGEHDLPGLPTTWWGWQLGDQLRQRPNDADATLQAERSAYLTVGQALPLGELMLYAGRSRDGVVAGRGLRLGADAEHRRSLELVWQVDLPRHDWSLEVSRLDERASRPAVWQLQSTRMLVTGEGGWRGLLEHEREREPGVAPAAGQWRWGVLWTRAL